MFLNSSPKSILPKKISRNLVNQKWSSFQESAISTGAIFKERRSKNNKAVANKGPEEVETGEAITSYTQAGLPYLRNIANVMTGSSCEVPSFILSLEKKN
ncbi:hypothetical protein OROMI_025224 [Orobanche minor]